MGLTEVVWVDPGAVLGDLMQFEYMLDLYIETVGYIGQWLM